jgi:hypothetical protein
LAGDRLLDALLRDPLTRVAQVIEHLGATNDTARSSVAPCNNSSPPCGLLQNSSIRHRRSDRSVETATTTLTPARRCRRRHRQFHRVRTGIRWHTLAVESGQTPA